MGYGGVSELPAVWAFLEERLDYASLEVPQMDPEIQGHWLMTWFAALGSANT